MSNRYRKINCCRICNNLNLELIIELGEQYLTGVFPHYKAEGEITRGPLTLVKCHGGNDVCGLLQLQHSYNLDEMYGDGYGYRSGLNASMVEHLHKKVSQICDKAKLNTGDLVIDIGSNDGTTLAAYAKNFELVGVDPAGEKFREYYHSDIKLLSDFFSADLINSAHPGKKAKVITSFAMFYDIENPVAFAEQIAAVLDKNEGLWVFEQSYMPLMLERTAYDTICHEHLEFYALKQIVWIAAKTGLQVIDVELNDINGGSFSVTVSHVGSIHQDVQGKVARLLHDEEILGLSTLKPFREFRARVEKNKITLQSFITKAKRDGKVICGLGASTKGNVLLQYCGFSEDDIDVIGDVNPDKYGALTPGTWIPIEEEARVLAKNSDYLLIFPWHFRDFFINNPAMKGRNLVFPLPTLEIFTP
jgi:NDP-4-keto-2,6-dideoxyhexose 3-C-methyltransferase